MLVKYGGTKILHLYLSWDNWSWNKECWETINPYFRTLEDSIIWKVFLEIFGELYIELLKVGIFWDKSQKYQRDNEMRRVGRRGLEKVIEGYFCILL